MRERLVTGGGGVRLLTVEHGPAEAPVTVLLHGIGQCRLSWPAGLVTGLARDHRVVLVDLRGHGGSDAPPDGYGDPALWAADVAAVLAAYGDGPDRPALVAWSYGAAVACDYLAAHGSAGLRALCLVGPCADLGPTMLPHLGGEFVAVTRRLLSSDPAVLAAAHAEFVDLLTATPLPPTDRGRVIGWNEVVPGHVRAGMLRRTLRHDDTLRAADLPALVVHGDLDRVVLPSAGARVADLLPRGRLVRYAGAGHWAFGEEPERFLVDLRALVA